MANTTSYRVRRVATFVSIDRSIGAARHFRLGTHTLWVSDGDVMLIPYELNRAVKHGVPSCALRGFDADAMPRGWHPTPGGGGGGGEGEGEGGTRPSYQIQDKSVDPR